MDEKKFCVKQVYEWLWKKGVCIFIEMINFFKGLCEKLEICFVINVIIIDEVQYSEDGIIKLCFCLYDGYLIEFVFILVFVDN